MEITITRPAALLRVPLHLLPPSSDPSRDQPRRYKRPLRFGWASIARAASAALDLAESENDRDICVELATVEVVGPILASRRYKVAEWMLDGPVVDPQTFAVVNGRHRLWGARAAGLRSAPALDDHLDWAIAATAEDWQGFVPDLESIESWVDNRAWWASTEATTWLALNPSHPAKLDTAIAVWRSRLS